MLVTKDNGFIFEHMEVLYGIIGLIAGGGIVYLILRSLMAGKQQYIKEMMDKYNVIMHSSAFSGNEQVPADGGNQSQ